MTTPLTFLGGVGTVTGSKYLLEFAGRRVLIDCGLFQGYKQLCMRNWVPLPVDPASLDAVILTHAHLDHSGYIPLLVRNGYNGPIYLTYATFDLCSILLQMSETQFFSPAFRRVVHAALLSSPVPKRSKFTALMSRSRLKYIISICSLLMPMAIKSSIGRAILNGQFIQKEGQTP